MLDLFKVLLRHLPLQADDLGGSHRRPLSLGEQLHALGGGIRPLVILAGQILRGKDTVLPRQGEVLAVDSVHVRLGEDGAGGSLKLLRAQARHVIAV